MDSQTTESNPDRWVQCWPVRPEQLIDFEGQRTRVNQLNREVTTQSCFAGHFHNPLICVTSRYQRASNAPGHTSFLDQHGQRCNDKLSCICTDNCIGLSNLYRTGCQSKPWSLQRYLLMRIMCQDCRFLNETNAFPKWVDSFVNVNPKKRLQSCPLETYGWVGVMLLFRKIAD